MYNKDSFNIEVSMIRNMDIQALVKKCLEKVPAYFYTMPASTTGKYHPEYSLGEGGLVRHTKAAVSIALDLLSLEQNRDLSVSRDEIIAALILHDSVKKGFDEGPWSRFDHPLCASKLVRETAATMVSPNGFEIIVEKICRYIESHMGEWNTDRFGYQIMPKPQSSEEKFVHMCDYLASRKTITVDVK